MAKFLLEYWVYRYNSIKTVTTDNGAEFEKQFVDAVQEIGAKFTLTTP
jgi:hypothetical protein